MAQFQDVIISVGLESKDFSTKVEALSRQYDKFIDTVTHTPIEIKFSEEGVKNLQKSLQQARQNLAAFASSIKQKFQLEFNPNIANLDQIKNAVNDKIASLQQQLDRSPLHVNIDPKIFNDAQKLLSTLEGIRKTEASGQAVGPKEQERVASLLSKLQGLERVFNKGFFEKFNADSITSGQRIDLLKTKLEQLSQLKAAQDRPNPALQNIINQLAELQKAFFSAKSVIPSLTALKQQVEGIFQQITLLQSTEGIPQEVITSFSNLAKTIHTLTQTESERKQAALSKRKEENEIDLRLTLATEEDKLRAKEASLVKAEQIDQQEVASVVTSEAAKTAAVQSGAEARVGATDAERAHIAQVEQTLKGLQTLYETLKTTLSSGSLVGNFPKLTEALTALKTQVSDPTVVTKIQAILNAIQNFNQQASQFDPSKNSEDIKRISGEAVVAVQSEIDSIFRQIEAKETEVGVFKAAETQKTNAVAEGVAARTEITSAGINVETQRTEEGVKTIISKIGKVALEFSGGAFKEPLEAIGRVSKDLSSSIDSNIAKAEDFVKRLSGLKVAPGTTFSEKNLQDNLILQKQLKEAYDNTVEAASKLKDVETSRERARLSLAQGTKLKEQKDFVGADQLGKEGLGFLQDAENIEKNFKLASARLVELSTEAQRSQNQIAVAESKANEKRFNDNQVLSAKLKVLEEEKTANLARAQIDRERLVKAGLFNASSAEEKAIQKQIKARETLNEKLLQLEKILQQQRAAIQASAAGLDIGQNQIFTERIRVAASEINKAKASVTAFTREEEKAVEVGGAFKQIFSGFTKNIFSSIGAVIKFNTAWRLTGFLIEAALSPITLFVKSIKDGFNFLVNLQQKMADVRESLVQNVTFARELAENFELAGKVSKFLTLEQERQASLIGVEADKFRQVFESFAATGGIKAVKKDIDDTATTLTRATRTTALLVAALNAVGVGSENTRRQTTEIGKLLEGQVSQRDRIRIAAKLSVIELNKQSLEAQKEGKFLEFVERLFGAQVKRLETASERFKELNTQVQFFVNRLQAAFVEQVFNEIVVALRDVLKFLRENEKELLVIARISGSTFRQLLVLLLRIGESFGIILSNVTKLFYAIVTLGGGIDDTTASLGKLKKESDGLSGLHEWAIRIARVFKIFNGIVDNVNTGLINLVETVKRFNPLDLGNNLSLDKDSPIMKDYVASLEAVTEAEARFAEERKKLVGNEDTLRHAIDGRLIEANEASLKGETKVAEEKKKIAETLRQSLKTNLEDQENLQKAFAVKEADFNKKRQAAAAKDLDIFIREQGRDKDKRTKIANEQFDALKELGKKSEKELLPPILGFPKREPPETKTKFDNDRLTLLKEAFKDEIEARTQATENFIAAQDKLESLGKLSEQRVTENTKAALDARTEALAKARDEFIAISRTLKEADPTAVAKFQSEITRQISDLRGKANKKKIEEDEKQGLLEIKLRDSQLNFERKQEIDQNEFLLELDKQAAEVGLKLKSETFDRAIELEQQKLVAELELLDQELANKEKNAERQQEVNQKALKAVEDFNKQVTLLNLERIKTVFEEEERLRETRLASFKISQEKEQQVARISSELGTRSDKFLQEQIALESQRLVIQEELGENETKLIKIKQEQVDIQKELDSIGAKVLAGTVSDKERLALKNNNTLLTEKSDLYRQIGLRIEEINSSLELQNIIIARSQAEEKARKNFGFQLGRSLFGNLPSTRLERAPIPVAGSTPGGIPNLEGFTTELKEAFKPVLVEAKPLSEVFKKLTAGGDDTIEALAGIGNAVTTVLNGITSAISAFQEGISQGIGSVLGTAGQLLQGTIAGEVLSIASSVVTGISAIFTALARRLAAQIEKSIDHILHDFERGFATLGDTIVKLENERLKAISELSGKKGGQKELDKILPGLEDKIQDLIQQQRDIQESFEDQLTALRLGNDSLVSFHDKWKDVVKTVKEYLGSFAEGEDLIKAQANAAEFLSLSLKRIREDFQNELEDGEKEAIQQAIKLNDLFDERKKLLEEIVKLQEEFNKAQFDLLTADAVEARVAGVVERGNKIVQLRKDFEEAKKEKEDRLAELNTEIAFQARIVAAQKAIFNLASSTAALKARSNALEESSLDRQLQKFKDIKEVIDGIKQDALGNFTISPNLLTAAGINPNTLNPASIRSTIINNPVFNINVPEGTNGEQFGRDMLSEWNQEQSRFGFQNS